MSQTDNKDKLRVCIEPGCSKVLRPKQKIRCAQHSAALNSRLYRKRQKQQAEFEQQNAPLPHEIRHDEDSELWDLDSDTIRAVLSVCDSDIFAGRLERAMAAPIRYAGGAETTREILLALRDDARRPLHLGNERAARALFLT